MQIDAAMYPYQYWYNSPFTITGTTVTAAATRKKRDLESRGVYGAAPRVPVCRAGQEVCSRIGGWGWTCVDTANDLIACGGCPGSKQAVDCTEVPGAGDVECIRGQCIGE